MEHFLKGTPTSRVSMVGWEFATVYWSQGNKASSGIDALQQNNTDSARIPPKIAETAVGSSPA